MGFTSMGIFFSIRANLLAFILLLLIGCSPESDKIANQSGPYLGQAQPGEVAQIFAPGIISNGLPVRDISAMPDGKEIYFSVVDHQMPLVTICYTKLVDGKWTIPAVAPFAKNRNYFYSEHHITPDGKRMMFSSTMPIEGESAKQGFDVENIWVMDREDDQWGEPYDIGAPINTQKKEFLPSTTHDGTLYFTRFSKGDEQIFLYRSHLAEGKCTEPKKLPSEVNAGKKNYNGYIAPDESYIVFNMVKGDEPPEYYVSFRSEDDEWSQAIKFDGRINLPNDTGYTMSISPNGKYLFFMSRKPADLNELFSGPTTYPAILKTATSPANGNSNIYWISTSVIESHHP